MGRHSQTLRKDYNKTSIAQINKHSRKKKKKEQETFETPKNYCFPLHLLQTLEYQCYDSIMYTCTFMWVGKENLRPRVASAA